VKRRRPPLAAVLALLLAGCPGTDPAPEKPPSTAEGAAGWAAGTSPGGATADADALATVAERLSGLDDAGGDPVWRRHAEGMDELWAQVERRHLAPMRAWSAATLAPLLPEPELALFYPFGGPDFLSAHVFFPAAPLYVLVGLQPPGRLPLPDELDGGRLEVELARLRGGFASLVEAGYFQQTDMDRDLAGERPDGVGLDGVLPVLYVFLARTGHRPVAVRHLALDHDGTLAAAGEATAASAVAVDFVREGGGETRRILYLAQDLSDQGLVDERPETARYLAELGPWNAFMKAAVYLLHREGFGALRELLLAEARSLLQDDSGLPYRDLAGGGWELSFFGRYGRTLPVYETYFQEDLKAVFAGGAAIRPLDFAIGYHGRIGEGCLLLANRRANRRDAP